MAAPRPLTIALAFCLGACATTAVESVASAPEPAPAPAPAPATEPGPPATIVPLSDAALRKSPTGSATIQHLALGQNAYLGRLEIVPDAEIPEHQDATEEFIHVLSGSGSITIEGVTQAIEAGSTVFMPAGATVSFKNGPEPMVGLQVFAGPEPASKYDAWADPDATVMQRPKPQG